jgi:hypothetical protein
MPGIRFFWLLFLNVIITMIAIVIIKKTADKYNIPLLRTLADDV